jgi:hypothetical protein
MGFNPARVCRCPCTLSVYNLQMKAVGSEEYDAYQSTRYHNSFFRYNAILKMLNRRNYSEPSCLYLYFVKTKFGIVL